MGVTGLTQYILRQSSLCGQVELKDLSDPTFVIDGNALVHFIFRSNFKSIDGAQSVAFEESLLSWIKLFGYYGNIIVVFDGALDKRKLDTRLARENKRVRRLWSLCRNLDEIELTIGIGNNSRDTIAVYLMDWSILVLKRIGIVVIESNDEADFEIAFLCKGKENYIAFSLDSDYFLFERMLYAPLDMMDMRSMALTVFDTKRIESFFSVSGSSLRYIGLLAGNDYITPIKNARLTFPQMASYIRLFNDNFDDNAYLKIIETFYGNDVDITRLKAQIEMPATFHNEPCSGLLKDIKTTRTFWCRSTAENGNLDSCWNASASIRIAIYSVIGKKDGYVREYRRQESGVCAFPIAFSPVTLLDNQEKMLYLRKTLCIKESKIDRFNLLLACVRQLKDNSVLKGVERFEIYIHALLSSCFCEVSINAFDGDHDEFVVPSSQALHLFAEFQTIVLCVHLFLQSMDFDTALIENGDSLSYSLFGSINAKSFNLCLHTLITQKSLKSCLNSDMKEFQQLVSSFDRFCSLAKPSVMFSSLSYGCSF